MISLFPLYLYYFKSITQLLNILFFLLTFRKFSLNNNLNKGRIDILEYYFQNSYIIRKEFLGHLL
jgi:hypothetical protein